MKFCDHKWKTILNIIINRFYLFSFNFQSTRVIFLCIDQCNLWGPHLIKITRREFSLNYLKDLHSRIWSLFSLSLFLILWYQTSGILMANTMHDYKITIIAPELNWRKRKKMIKTSAAIFYLIFTNSYKFSFRNSSILSF